MRGGVVVHVHVHVHPTPWWHPAGTPQDAAMANWLKLVDETP